MGLRFHTAVVAIAIALPSASAPAMAAPGDFHSQWIGQNPDPIVGVGTTTSHTIRFRNAGTATWQRGLFGAQVNLGIAGDSGELFDQGLAVSWLSPNRIATTAEEAVAPGGIGTFTFAVRSPSPPGRYRVPLRLVVDGVTWLDDEGVYFDLIAVSGFGARWDSQTAYPTVHQGEPATISISFRNTGARAFVRGSAGQQLNLGVATDDTSWGRYGVGWLSRNRVATTNQSTVPPGAIARFTFVVRGPTAAGRYVVRLRAVVDGVAVVINVAARRCDAPAVTAEGIRTAFYFAVALGRELRLAVDGQITRAQALERYHAFSDEHAWKFRWLLRAQHLVGAKPRGAGPGVERLDHREEPPLRIGARGQHAVPEVRAPDRLRAPAARGGELAARVQMVQRAPRDAGVARHALHRQAVAAGGHELARRVLEDALVRARRRPGPPRRRRPFRCTARTVGVAS